MKVSFVKDDESISEKKAKILVSDVVPFLEDVDPPSPFSVKTNFTDTLRYVYYNREMVDRVPGYRPLPISKNYSLFPHQIEAIRFMRSIETGNKPYGIKGGILRFHMGLGKSLTSIAHSLTSPRPPREGAPGGFPTLIIVKKSIINMWLKEAFREFFDNRVRVLPFHKEYTTKMTKITRQQVLEYDFVVTTFDVLDKAAKLRDYQSRGLVKGPKNIMGVKSVSRREADIPSRTGLHILYCTPWERIICDEIQAICSYNSNRFRNCKALYGEHIWGLTGTPIMNNFKDIWGLFSFCGFSSIDNPKKFKCSHIRDYGFLKYILNMTYADAGISMPPKSERVIPVTMGKKEKRLYTLKLEFARTTVRGMSYACVLALLTGLRQFCNSPFLDSPENKKIPSGKYMEERCLERLRGRKWPEDPFGEGGIGCVKIRAILEILQNLKEKVIIFSSFSRFLRILQIALGKADITSDLYIGDFTSIQNRATLRRFQNTDELKALLMTYQIGSEGLNITEAKAVICVEPWWNHVVQNQAIHRAWRIGQGKEVKVFSFFVENSIEVPIIDLCKKKKEMAKKLENNRTDLEIKSKLSLEEIRKILREGE